MFVKFLLSSVNLEKLFKTGSVSNYMSIIYIFIEKHKPSMLKHFQFDDLRNSPYCNYQLKERVMSEFQEVDYISYFVQPYQILSYLNQKTIKYIDEDLPDSVAINLIIRKEREEYEKRLKEQKDEIIKKALDDFIVSKD